MTSSWQTNIKGLLGKVEKIFPVTWHMNQILNRRVILLITYKFISTRIYPIHSESFQLSLIITEAVIRNLWQERLPNIQSSGDGLVRFGTQKNCKQNQFFQNVNLIKFINDDQFAILSHRTSFTKEYLYGPCIMRTSIFELEICSLEVARPESLSGHNK